MNKQQFILAVRIQAKRQRNQKGGAQMAEFAPALFVFLLITLFPLINLIGYATGVATVQLISRQTAQAAGSSSTYDDALVVVQQKANSLLNSSWGKFAKIQPVGGINGCGVDVYVHGTSITSNQTTTYGPDTPVPAPIDTTNTVWEYSTKVNYLIYPWVNLSTVPFVANIPMVGQPSTLCFSVDFAAEFPQGLIGNGLVAGGGGGGLGGGGGTGQPNLAPPIPTGAVP